MERKNGTEWGLDSGGISPLNTSMNQNEFQMETVGSYRSQWGEGPIWHDGALVYVDIENGKVIRLSPCGEEKITDVKDEVGRVGTVVARDSGGLIVAGDKGFFSVAECGEVTALGDPEPEKADNRFNDGKCSPDGHFFAGTISLVKKEGDARLYRLGKCGKIDEVYGPVTNSNGIVWSKSGDTMFYIDTPTKQVLAFEYKDGELGAKKAVIDTSNYEASPDGMAIDEDDNVWIAFCHGACVIQYCTETGKELRKIDLPCLETTACVFGGENLDELYVTTGIHKSEVEEDAGLVFKITGLGVRGQKSYSYQG